MSPLIPERTGALEDVTLTRSATDFLRRWAPSLLALAGVLAYANSLNGAFVFDDEPNIVLDPLVQMLWPPWRLIRHSQRPVVDLSFATNYALGGLQTIGYHVVNVAIHVLAGCTLFGILRRTLSSQRMAARYGTRAATLAFVISLLWLVHPLQTQSVTYIVQRAESLMGLLYLITLYAVIRQADGQRSVLWGLVATMACSLGMATKQVMVTAPVVVLLYDRTFLAGSFRGALKRRPFIYLGLAATWSVLILVMDGHLWTPGAAGFAERPAVSPWEYARSQPGVLLHYLRLSVWPHPLVFDYYHWPAAPVPHTVALIGLLLATAWALRARPALGFAGAWFFVILSVTSSIIPIADPAFEHRMYLPLAAVISVLVIAGSEGVDRVAAGRSATARPLFVLAVLVGVALGATTARRNRDYASVTTLWQTVTDAAPDNLRAHINLGVAYFKTGLIEPAQASLEHALVLEPGSNRAKLNLAAVFIEQQRFIEASDYLQSVLAVDPGNEKAHANLAFALFRRGDLSGATAHLEQALVIKPGYAKAHNDLGVVHLRQGKLEEAVADFERALQLDPQHPEAGVNLRGARNRLERGMP